MFDFNEFLDYVMENIPEHLPESLMGAQISLREVRKNNDLILHGMEVLPEDSNIAPSIYLDNFFKQYEEGKDLNEIMDKIADTIVSHINVPEEYSDIVEKFKDFEFVKNNIIMAAVNTERNENLLLQVPHHEKEDLSLIYKVMLGRDNEDISTITIRNEHMDMWGVTADDLYELAFTNTRKILPITIRPMTEVLRGLFEKNGMPAEMSTLMFEEMPPSQQMYVISNEAMVNGAVSMFYTDGLSELAKKVGTDLYILPSSVHEVIAVSTEMGTPEFLSDMVRDVNGTQVSREEQLSDHIYCFNAAKKTLSLVSTSNDELEASVNVEDHRFY